MRKGVNVGRYKRQVETKGESELSMYWWFGFLVSPLAEKRDALCVSYIIR